MNKYFFICFLIVLLNYVNYAISVECGKGIGRCKNNKCCSKYGYCGTSEKHCGFEEGFQYDFGKCDDPFETEESKNGECGRGKGKCPNNKCCSKYGYCGTSEKHCSVEKGCQAKYGKCGDRDKNKGRCGKNFGLCSNSDLCCSKYGHCGNTGDYCGTGCQKVYGICW